MQIGWLPSPTEWERWPEVVALLEPAARQGPVPILEDGEMVWVVLDGPAILGAATARLCENGSAEVVLVGGRDHRRWLDTLDDELGSAARAAGATRLTAYGRRGWAKALSRRGWEAIDMGNNERAYVRHLGV